jgi:phosphoribosylformylglycinamidine cyclo-ligase
MTEPGKPKLRYRDVGVNIDAQDEVVRGIKTIVRETYDANVLRDIGSFGAMYSLDVSGMEQPVLVSSVDSLGTKLKVAIMANRFNTVGLDIVGHCVNDILAQGARPLFFLDYIACNRMVPDIMIQIIKGMGVGCRYAGCALIGGEMAEMPEVYREGELEVAGTIVGAVDRKRIIDGSAIKENDLVIGLDSSGLHTNGYTMARKICFEVAGLGCDDLIPGVGRTVADALLEPHRNYARMIQILLKIVPVKGMAHITGGGITDNLPRILPEGLGAEINVDAWTAPPLFRFLQETGNVDDSEMLRTFNMGMGYLVVVDPEHADKTLDSLQQTCEDPKVIGRIVPGEGTVQYAGNLRYDT